MCRRSCGKQRVASHDWLLGLVELSEKSVAALGDSAVLEGEQWKEVG